MASDDKPEGFCPNPEDASDINPDEEDSGKVGIDPEVVIAMNTDPKDLL